MRELFNELVLLPQDIYETYMGAYKDLVDKGYRLYVRIIFMIPITFLIPVIIIMILVFLIPMYYLEKIIIKNYKIYKRIKYLFIKDNN